MHVLLNGLCLTVLLTGHPIGEPGAPVGSHVMIGPFREIWRQCSLAIPRVPMLDDSRHVGSQTSSLTTHWTEGINTDCLYCCVRRRTRLHCNGMQDAPRRRTSVRRIARLVRAAGTRDRDEGRYDAEFKRTYRMSNEGTIGTDTGRKKGTYGTYVLCSGCRVLCLSLRCITSSLLWSSDRCGLSHHSPANGSWCCILLPSPPWISQRKQEMRVRAWVPTKTVHADGA
ncbi:hypothetical protein PENSPDRAFT_298108 [Peniophora sp. CONT]|nr:hypothetical protein PENSPDRAFT_298108 [Peniophora sp. CONT]